MTARLIVAPIIFHSGVAHGILKSSEDEKKPLNLDALFKLQIHSIYC